MLCHTKKPPYIFNKHLKFVCSLTKQVHYWLQIRKQSTIFKQFSFTITIFYGFFILLCTSANYISSRTNDPCCMYKSIQKHWNDTNDKIILTNNDVPSHNFISFSFFSFFNFQIHSTTGKNCLQQNSFGTSTQWLNMTIFFFLQL